MAQNFDLRSDLITPRTALSLVAAFTAAYEMAVYTVDTIDFLKEYRDQALPHIKNWAVESELHRRSKEGVIPFEATMHFNSRHNHKHLELRKNEVTLTVSQTQAIKMPPRECCFRNAHCLEGQTVLPGFDDLESEPCDKIYAILTHGWGTVKPAFIVCGIPNHNMTAWIQSINLLQLVGNAIIDESPITNDIVLDFKDKVVSKKEHSLG